VSNFINSPSFDSLMAVLKNAGISDSIYFRSRDAGITANTVINANNITLVADKGAVDIMGSYMPTVSLRAAISMFMPAIK